MLSSGCYYYHPHFTNRETIVNLLWTDAQPRLLVSLSMKDNKFQAGTGQRIVMLGFPCGSAGKVSTCSAGDLGSIPKFGKIPWRRERLPTPVFWPGEFHGLYSLWGHKDCAHTTEQEKKEKQYYSTPNIPWWF